MCDVFRQSHAEVLAEYGFQVEADRTVVRVRDANGNALFSGYPQRKVAALLKIRMDNPVFRMLLEEGLEFALIPSEVLGIHRAHAVNVPAQRLDLILIGRTVIAVDQKIVGDFLTVEVTKVIHHHGFGATSVHDRIKHQYAHRSILSHDEPPP